MSTGFEAFRHLVDARLWTGQSGGFTVVLLEAQVLCNMMLCHWTAGLWKWRHHVPLKHRGISHPLTQWPIQEDCCLHRASVSGRDGRSFCFQNIQTGIRTHPVLLVQEVPAVLSLLGSGQGTSMFCWSSEWVECCHYTSKYLWSAQRQCYLHRNIIMHYSQSFPQWQ